MSNDLEFVERVHIGLRGGTYRWLDIKRFLVSSHVDDKAALDLLLRHERYQDHYATDEAHWEPTGNLHGPYVLDRLDQESFELIEPASARRLLHEWADQWGLREEKNLPELTDAANEVINGATTIYLLRNLRESAQHEWGWVLGEFHELVVLDRDNGSLTLMVASDD